MIGTRFARILLVILATAALVRLWRLDYFSYGLDEIMQGYFVQGTWSFFWKSLTFDAVHPPLDYLVTRALESLSPANWVRKLPSVVWGLGTIAALANLLRRRAGEAVGLLASLLLAFAPFHVRYSQELRPYSLGLFLLCLSLLLLDLLLERVNWFLLIGFFLSCLATAYSLYLAALVLGIASLAILVDEAFGQDAPRRRRARRFLAFSPMFLLALFVAYLPWMPVVVEASTRPPPVPAPAMTWERFSRFLSVFSFAPNDGQPLGRKGPFFLLLVGAGLAMAARRRSTRFLVVWFVGGCAAIELLEHLHPHWYVTRHFLAAGIVFPALASFPLAWLSRRRPARVLAFLLAALVLVFDLRSLAVYYREGRADWRPLARYLTARPSSERIFTENWYTALCVAFYVAGPEYLSRGGRTIPEVYSLEGEPVRLAWSWKPGTTAWLVLGGQPPDKSLREWSHFFPSLPFPTAEGAILLRLDPSLWGRMAKTVPRTLKTTTP